MEIRELLERVEQGETSAADALALGQLLAQAMLKRVSEGLPRASPQQAVYEAVVTRGYRRDWTAHQFAARQVAKLAEELGELIGGFQLPKRVSFRDWLNRDWVLSLRGTAGLARLTFADRLAWEEARVADVAVAKAELADLQVVVFCLAEVLGELAGEPFDVVAAALDKAGQDVERGVNEVA